VVWLVIGLIIYIGYSRKRSPLFAVVEEKVERT
jgi:hypothetical protein